jgi:hypothetical protein
MSSPINEIVREIEVLRDEIRSKEMKLRENKNALRAYIMQKHPNPRCEACKTRLNNHRYRHQFVACLKNIEEIK